MPIAHDNDDLAQHVIESIDQITDSIEDLLHTDESCSDSDPDHDTDHRDTDDDNDTNSDPVQPQVGDAIEVFWPMDSQYYPGSVTEISDSGYHTVTYDDGDTEALLINEENWRFANTLQSSTVTSLPMLESNEQTSVGRIFDFFGNKPFLRHQAQGFDQAALENAYSAEETAFLKTVQPIPRSAVSDDANIIGSHTIYKIKSNDDKSLKIKARIAPHGNEDSMKSEMKSDCCICSPTGVRIVLTFAALFGWKVRRDDALTAFLQTGEAQRAVYVVPPKECRDRRFLWLLLAAVYGLVNSNAKWQVQSDEAILQIGLVQSKFIPQLFYKIENSRLVLIVAKTFDDLMVSGEPDEADNFGKNFGKRFKLDSSSHGPGRMQFF